METVVFKDTAGYAADIIKNGGLVAVPTETVYGLAANGLDRNAVKRIYDVKGRPALKPLALMVRSAEMIDSYCADVPAQAYALAEKFWPGPLTIVLKAKNNIPDIVLAGGSTVGLRCPDNKLTLQLIEQAGVPLAAPSANPSGSKSPNSAEEVLSYFNGRIDAVIDGGFCDLGVASTILDMSAAPYRVLRQGVLSEEKLKEALTDGLTVIGLTGGSGSGKTTVLNWLEKKGAMVIDCDDLYHHMLRTDSDLMNAVSERFPGAVSETGEINRKKLSDIVFTDEDALLDLNRITHSLISDRVKQMLKDFAFSGGRFAALDAVELISSGLSSICDYTVAVIAEKESRISRIMVRDGIGREDAILRINAQKEHDYYINNCSHVLLNDSSSLEEFENKCEEFFGGILNERNRQYQK